ncbi:AAA family ATPase, partial [Shigella flexneri 2a]|nr:AAA family ATPase [Shigella flexneri 2a]
MVGNTDMARAYALIAAGGGRAVASGDTDQLQAIAPGQPFRLQQTRSAADVVIMKEIVRQTPIRRQLVLPTRANYTGRTLQCDIKSRLLLPSLSFSCSFHLSVRTYIRDGSAGLPPPPP